MLRPDSTVSFPAAFRETTHRIDKNIIIIAACEVNVGPKIDSIAINYSNYELSGMINNPLDVN